MTKKNRPTAPKTSKSRIAKPAELAASIGGSKKIFVGNLPSGSTSSTGSTP